MAYTTPDTAVTGVVAPAAMWNTGVRDNLETAVMTLRARKISDQSVTSSTVLVDCTAMALPVAANGIYEFRFIVIYEALTAGDIKIGFTFPTSGDLRLSIVAATAADTFGFPVFSSTTSPTIAATFSGQNAGAYLVLPFEGVFVNGANAGNLQLQFAQGTSNATATTVKAHSTVWAAKLA